MVLLYLEYDGSPSGNVSIMINYEKVYDISVTGTLTTRSVHYFNYGSSTILSRPVDYMLLWLVVKAK